MKAVVYRGRRQVAVEDRPVPACGNGEVLIRVRMAGVCGTDLSIVAGQHPRARPGLVMGHEFVGTVHAVGADVSSGIQPGARVVVEPLISCGRCYACRSGFAHVCERLGLYGIDADGAFAEFVKVSQDKVFAVPDELPDTAAALIEPLAVAVHAVRLSALKIGDAACVLGGGPIGLLTALVAREAGLQALTLVEPQPYRLALARQFGIATLDPAQCDVDQTIRQQTGGRGVAVVFEAAGAPDAVLLAPRLCCVRGQVVQIAIPKTPREMDLVALTFKELNMVGVRVYDAHDFERAIALAARLGNDLEKLASPPYPLEHAGEAFGTAEQGDRALKVVFGIG